MSIIIKNYRAGLSNRYNIVKALSIYLTFLVIVVSASCKKFIDVPLPIDQVTSADVFDNDETAGAAVTGLYTQMMSSNLYFFNGALTLYPALSADELYPTSPNENIEPFYNNAIPSTSTIIQNDTWRTAYQVIYHANDCLEGLQSSTGISSGTQQQLMGEVKFVRAFTYFYLVNLFNDVPLELTTSYQQNSTVPRTEVSTVYEQIISDLKDAEQLLTTAYVTNEPIRPNKWTATALLARVYLYNGKWAEAETKATNIINSGSYSLLNDLNSVFLAGSAEAIWQLYPVLPDRNTAEGQTFIPAPGFRPFYSLTPFLLSSFEQNDKRKIFWIDSVVIDGKAYSFPYKYKVKSSSDKTEYNTVFRLAEQYLIRAEARAHQDNLSGAVNDINIIRKRAGLNALPVLTQTACLTAINIERQHEFFTEWGHRWFELKRTGQADNILGTEKPGWDSNDALYPIPFNEIQLNQNLSQNPGY